MVPWPILIDFLISPGTQIEFVLLKKSTIEWLHFVLFTIMFIYFRSSCSVCSSLSSFIPAILMTAYRLRLVLIVILDQVLIAEPLP